MLAGAYGKRLPQILFEAIAPFAMLVAFGVTVACVGMRELAARLHARRRGSRVELLERDPREPG
jgi:hypothetical protein